MVKYVDEKIDSDYIPSDNDTYITNDTDNESIETTMTHISSLLEILEEQDILDIMNDIHSEFGEFLTINISKLSSPSFYKDMFYYIAYILYEEWNDAELYGNINDDDSSEEESFNELLEFVEQIWNIYIDFFILLYINEIFR